MRNLKKYVVAVALASAFTVNANAAVVNLGSGQTDLTANTVVGAFTDVYKFVLTEAGSFNYSLTVRDLDALLPSSTSPTGFATYSIFDFKDGTAGFSYGLFDSTNNSVGIHPSSLAAGSYSLKITGFSTGIAGGRYNLQASIASAVPEPETNLMMMLGLAAIGTLVYRKKSAV